MPRQNNSGGGGGPWGGGGNNNNGGGDGRSPWGAGGSGRPPPDVEEMVRQSQEKLKQMIPGGLGGKGIFIIILVGLALWMATGFYKVDTKEQGVELVFGKLYSTTLPGLHYNYPSPIGEVLLPQVTNVNQTEVGYRGSIAARSVLEESQMLTGDENIIDIKFSVLWKIDDAGKFLFNVRNPEATVKNAAEAAMREVVGKSAFDFVRTSGVTFVSDETTKLVQSILDSYGAGIFIQEVKVQQVDPPSAVIDAFRDVQRASADKESTINEATAYSNQVTEKAQGQADQITRAAEAYKEERIAQASGDAARFLSVFAEYDKAKEITKRRIYLETMEEIMEKMDKVLIENGAEGEAGVLPYLPLNELIKKKAQ